MRRAITLLALIALLVSARCPMDAAQPSAAPLRIGDTLPPVSGQTLTGQTLRLPAASLGQASILIFSFSRVAGKDARQWNEHLVNGSSGGIPVYMVIMLESAPKLFRGMAIAGIKSTMPPLQQSRTIVLYSDEQLWKSRLAVTNDSRAFVLLLDENGRLRWMNSGAFTDAEYSRLQNEASRSTRPHP